MTEDERCRHPDCIYRNHVDPEKSGNCDYCRMEGKPRLSRLAKKLGLPPERVTHRMKLPVNCPFYEPDGVTPPAPETAESWRDIARRLYDQGATDREIADRLGKDINRVGTIRRKQWKLPPNPGPHGPAVSIDYKRAEEMARRGANDREIAQALGCSVSAVYKWRNKSELLPNAGKKGGEKT